MKREIKFRQWQGKGRLFHYFEFTDGMCSGVTNASLSQYPIMQFTGLHDENGKEIYEGDILRSFNFHDHLVLSVVTWNEKEGKWQGSDTKDGMWNRNAELFYIFEVIGNIHSNPELL